jgi:hypothetical protein
MNFTMAIEPRPAVGEQGRRVVYGWFTQGFDTADLKEPRALLAEVG